MDGKIKQSKEPGRGSQFNKKDLHKYQVDEHDFRNQHESTRINIK